jgi:hypothetical protein
MREKGSNYDDPPSSASCYTQYAKPIRPIVDNIYESKNK